MNVFESLRAMCENGQPFVLGNSLVCVTERRRTSEALSDV